MIFGGENSLFVHADNSQKYIPVLGEGTTDRLGDNTIIAEVKFLVNVINPRKKLFKSEIQCSKQFFVC